MTVVPNEGFYWAVEKTAPKHPTIVSVYPIVVYGNNNEVVEEKLQMKVLGIWNETVDFVEQEEFDEYLFIEEINVPELIRKNVFV